MVDGSKLVKWSEAVQLFSSSVLLGFFFFAISVISTGRRTQCDSCTGAEGRRTFIVVVPMQPDDTGVKMFNLANNFCCSDLQEVTIHSHRARAQQTGKKSRERQLTKSISASSLSEVQGKKKKNI